MSLLLRTPWTSQPQYPAGINLAHSLGPWVLAQFNAGASLRFGQSFPTTIGGTPTVGSAGKCIDYASTKTQYPFDAAIANGMVTAAGCAVLVICDVDTLTNYGCLFSSEETTTQKCALEVRIGSTATDSKIWVTRGTSYTPGSGAYRGFESAANRITAGDKRIVLLVSLPDANVQSAPTVYINGVAYSMSNVSGTATGTVAAPTSVGVCLGGRSSDTVTPLDGRIYNAWVFGRGVTEAEGIAATQTLAGAYALFASQVQRIRALSTVAPGGSTITTALLPGGYGYLGSGQTKAILPAGVGYMG